MSLKQRFAEWIARREIRKWLEQRLHRRLSKEERQLMKNWKTTVLGVLAGLTGGSVAGWQTPDGAIHWGAVALAVVISLLGHFAKDRDTTGIGATATKG